MEAAREDTNFTGRIFYLEVVCLTVEPGLWIMDSLEGSVLDRRRVNGIMSYSHMLLKEVYKAIDCC